MRFGGQEKADMRHEMERMTRSNGHNCFEVFMEKPEKTWDK